MSIFGRKAISLGASKEDHVAYFKAFRPRELDWTILGKMVWLVEFWSRGWCKVEALESHELFKSRK